MGEIEQQILGKATENGFGGGGVWIDQAQGTATGSGSLTDPTNTIANAQTIMTAQNMGKAYCRGIFALTQQFQNLELEGFGSGTISDTLSLNGQNVSGSIFSNLLIVGIPGSLGEYRNCRFNAATLLGWYRRCEFYGNCAVSGLLYITDGYGESTLVLDFSGMATLGQIIGFSGEMTIANMDAAATLNIYGDAGTFITLNNTCASGTINIYGDVVVTDNSAGTTVNRYDLEGRTKGLDAIYDLGAATLTDTGTMEPIVSALPTLTETGSDLTTDGTEQNAYINDAPAGVFSPKVVKINFTNQTAAETVVVRYYERIQSGGGYIQADEVTFTGVQAIPLKYVSLKENRFGVKVTMQRTAGNAKLYRIEPIYEV